MNTLVLHDVGFGYGPQRLFEHLDLTIEQGSFWMIEGANGAGKSTLMKLMLGLLKPDRGSVTLFDQPASQGVGKGRIGYLPQTPPEEIERVPLTPEELLRMKLSEANFFSFQSGRLLQAMKPLIEQFGLASFQHRILAQLSGGQRQRALLASACATKPALLFLDEPTKGLDHAACDELMVLLRSLHAQGMTIIMITHDRHLLKEPDIHRVRFEHERIEIDVAV